MNWQEHLAEEARRRATRRNEAAKKSEERRRVQARHSAALLPLLAAALKRAADGYNRAAAGNIRVEGPRKGAMGDTLELTREKTGYRFEDSGKGFIRIFEFDAERQSEYAFLQPLLNRAGDLVGWQEKQVFSGGKTLGRTVDSLSEAYLVSTARRAAG